MLVVLVSVAISFWLGWLLRGFSERIERQGERIRELEDILNSMKVKSDEAKAKWLEDEYFPKNEITVSGTWQPSSIPTIEWPKESDSSGNTWSGIDVSHWSGTDWSHVDGGRKQYILHDDGRIEFGFRSHSDKGE